MTDFSLSSSTDVYIEGFLESLAHPRALTVLLLYRAGEWTQLLDLEFRPENYNDLDSARCALAATSFLSKASFLPTPWDKEQRAIEKFFAAEEKCRETNHRIWRGHYKNVTTAAVASAAAAKIRSILGDTPSIDRVLDQCGWGPGATTLLPRRQATQPRKFSAERQITPEAYYAFKDILPKAWPLWGDFMLEVVHSNRVVTVPKNSKTDRVIAIEPGINSWFQKGYGKEIRRLLRYAGLDLNDQRHNQERSREGSKFNHLATIDFSAASDTIAEAVVSELLPRNWYLALDMVRTRFGSYQGKEIRYAKFSSMGNGYTFELESLLFWAVALACCEYLGVGSEGVSVFGDDVTLPVAALDLFRSTCTDLGFSFNDSKTFVSGPFRESCGEYHWCGARIKPIFLKEPLHGPEQILLAANSVRRLAHRWLNGLGCDNRFNAVWRRLVDFMGSNAPRISEGYGDVGIIENIDDPSVSACRHPSFEGWSVRVWSTVATSIEEATRGLLLFRLQMIGADLEVGAGNRVPSSQMKVSRSRLLIRRWYDLGPWL